MYQPAYQNEQTDLLVRALLSLNTPEEMYRFLDDVLTVQEMQSIAQRVHVAQLLRKGGTYQEISHETGASTTTVTRVNRSLRYGAEGYAAALDRVLGDNGGNE